MPNQIVRAFSQPQTQAPVEWSEFPKHIYPDHLDGSTPTRNARYIVVNNADEEEAVLQSGAVESEDDARERMMAIVAQKGLKIDKRWGLGKISAAIEAAGYDPSVNPFA